MNKLEKNILLFLKDHPNERYTIYTLTLRLQSNAFHIKRAVDSLIKQKKVIIQKVGPMQAIKVRN